ncbi:hypothetical protein O3P69_018389 [Scylla paramamosain]|uniref:Uncharacterized protein n=1 Tax=Scylla paramamosain TaxID=85552 RepID=A0AAW0SB51_SCYPA
MLRAETPAALAAGSDVNASPRDEDRDEGFRPGREEERKRKRRGNRDRRQQVLGVDDSRGPLYQGNQRLRKFKAASNDHFRTGFDVVDALAQAHPDLQLKVRPNVRREVIITALTEESAETLARTTTIADKPAPLEELDPEDRLRRWVVTKFPLGLDPELLKRNSQVLEAERCTLKDRVQQTRTVPTRQVVIKASGTFPDGYIDLKWYGKYQIRPFTPEPLRCFRCQRIWPSPKYLHQDLRVRSMFRATQHGGLLREKEE